MAKLLEIGMLLFFGISWPANLLKSWRARTTTGKSIVFLTCISTGYLCGIASKFAGGTVNYVVFFYALNLLMVMADIVLYFRNRRLDGIRKLTALPEDRHEALH